MSFLYAHDRASTGDPIGGKAAGLTALKGSGIRMPAWFALAPAAFDVRETECGSTAELSAVARAALPDALRSICPGGERVAVRSSAMEEDSAAHSFAGQLRSYLSVRHDEVPAHATAVWQSAFEPSVLRYRSERGLLGAPPPPAVLVQRMVDADLAGVAFGADPVTGSQDQVVLSAVRGLGAALVKGLVEGQTFRVDAEGGVHRQSPGPSILSDTQAREVAALTRRAGEHLGRPQDIEWAIAPTGDLFLLQSRPITSLGADLDVTRDGAAPADTLTIWDNSNIVESYRGITGPLTFSFARAAYEGVYRQFCRLLHVPSAVIDAHDTTFKHMLGWVNGRIYYNLLNWYRVLAMLPGYKLNREFMEQMMGVKEGLPDEIADRIAAGNTTSRFADGFRALSGLGGLLGQLFGLRETIGRFRRRLDAALRSGRVPLDAMPTNDLAQHYRALEARLLTRWDAPLLNDFFCMIFYGILARLTTRWSDRPGLHDELLQGSGGMRSAEPTRRLRELGALARREPRLANQLLQDAPESLQTVIEGHPELRDAYQEYLARFGERCVEELKLESPTLHDDPTPLLRAIGQVASQEAHDTVQRTTAASMSARLDDAMPGHPLRRALYRAVLRQTRVRIRERENLRLERTRVFGRVRRIFVELGKRLHADGHLRAARDVFYLEVEDVLEAACRPATAPLLQRNADAARQAESRFRARPAPPDRFETRGSVADYVPPAPSSPHETLSRATDEQARGLGCSPGIARGKVRVVRDPRIARVLPGEILVAETTDPGWILLFSLASGLVVERGSPLSHSAIVARELGMPAVVGLAEATTWLRDGDDVLLDGAAGTVRRICGGADDKPG